LLTLSAMSSLFLISLFTFWLEEEGLLRYRSAILCKLLTFVAHFCDFSSVWLIVLVGFERLILLYRASRAMNKAKAQRHCGVLLIASFLFNSWILFVANVNEMGDCDILPEYEFLYAVMNTVETVFCMGLPSGIILISNLFVVLRLQSHLKRIPSSPTVSFNTADLLTNSALPPTTLKPASVARYVSFYYPIREHTYPHTLLMFTKYIYCASLKNLCISFRSSIGRLSSRFSLSADASNVRKRHHKNLRYADLQLTRSLLVVTWVFIALNLPNYIYRIFTHVIEIDNQSVGMRQISLFVHILLYTHHALLFYLYIFYSPQMKKRLLPTALKLLECYCLKQPAELSDHT
uniref:G_PROTEIN_RECEP_F1_2 domain-containing protein n=1 Tax=Toxocara canis TaxID=6265 RepID=A0A183UTB1_TOXCA